MAAGHKTPVAMDPALVKYQNMFVHRHKFFRWTPRTVWITFVYVAAIPFGFYMLGSRTEGKYEFRGKKRGDPIVEF